MTGLNWPCGHPRSPEYTQSVGINNGERCRACRRAISRRSQQCKRARILIETQRKGP